MDIQNNIVERVLIIAIRIVVFSLCILVAVEFRGMYKKLEEQQKKNLILKQTNEMLRMNIKGVEKLDSVLERIREKLSDPTRKRNELFLLYLKDPQKFSEKITEMNREISKRRALWKLQEKANGKKIKGKEGRSLEKELPTE